MKRWWRQSQMPPITPTWPRRGSASAWSRWVEAIKTSVLCWPRVTQRSERCIFESVNNLPFLYQLAWGSWVSTRAPVNTSRAYRCIFAVVADEVDTRCYRCVFRGSPERSKECQYPARPSRGVHPEPGIWEGWGAGSCSEIYENCNATAKIWSDKIFIYLSAFKCSHDTVCLLSAVEDYKEALDFDDKQEIKEGLERAQKLLKISQKRDYYKILGVSR